MPTLILHAPHLEVLLGSGHVPRHLTDFHGTPPILCQGPLRELVAWQCIGRPRANQLLEVGEWECQEGRLCQAHVGPMMLATRDHIICMFQCLFVTGRG